jgi:hypothetical protein
LTWTPAEVTKGIQKIAFSRNLSLTYALHAKERMLERSIIISDVLYILKNGFVHNDCVPSTRAGLNRYAIESKSPNSSNRAIRIVVIPHSKSCHLKIVTVMWVDEKETVGGSIIGEYNEK